MASTLKLGYYSNVYWRPVVERGGVVAFVGRKFLCGECSAALHDGSQYVSGQVGNVRWSSKGYDECGERPCLCGKVIEGGEEINLTVNVSVL